MRISKTFLAGAAFVISSVSFFAACVADDPIDTTTPPDGDGGSDGTTPLGDASNEGAVTCSNTTSDPANCGACGHACATGFSCTNSVCGNAAVAIAAGGEHTCVALARGDVWCWGNNNDGEIGNGTTSDGGLPPTLVPRDSLGQTVTAVSFGTGASHTCALKSDHTVVCWGDDSYAQVGDGQDNDDGGFRVDPTPVHTRGGATFNSLAVGPKATNACGIDPSGTILCWGDDGETQTSAGIQDAGAYFTQCPSGDDCFVEPSNFVSDIGAHIATGSSSTCAITSDGGVACWGNGHEGEHGDGIHANVGDSPESYATLPQAASFIATGDESTCVILKPDGAVWCWGVNNDDELGHDDDAGLDVCCSILCFSLGHTECNPTPAQVAGISGATALAMGGAHACALKNDNTVWCWGSNASGQLGTGDNVGSFVPRQVSGISDAIAIAAGENHTCAIHKDGTVSCWGSNIQLQLGAGVADSTLPVKIPGLPQ